MENLTKVTAAQYYAAMSRIILETSSQHAAQQGKYLVMRNYAKKGKNEVVISEMYIPINDSFVIARYEMEKSEFFISKKYAI